MANVVGEADPEDLCFDEAIKTLQMLSPLSTEEEMLDGSGYPPFRNRPVAKNPFAVSSFQVDDETVENEKLQSKSSEDMIRQIFGQRCECGADRRSPRPGRGNVQDGHATARKCSSKTISSDRGEAVANGGGVSSKLSPVSPASSLEHGIINPTSFKQKAKVEKRVIVREAVLKNIGKCVHQSVNAQRLSLPASLVDPPSSAQGVPSTTLPLTSLKPSLSENNLAKYCTNTAIHSESDGDGGILDFKLLVSRCSEMTLAAGSPAQVPLLPDFAQGASFVTLRQCPSSTMASSRHPPTRKSPRKGNSRLQLKRYNSASSLESDCGSSNSQHCNSSNSQQQPCSTVMTSLSKSSPSSPASSVPAALSASPTSGAAASSSSSTASCSTQARQQLIMNPASASGTSMLMPCDVTIDEMASYFETLVHIPKKMSTMAEMMYI